MPLSGASNILSHIFLGGAEDARGSGPWTAVISCGVLPEPQWNTDASPRTWLQLDLLDEVHASLFSILPTATQFLAAALREVSPRILVHCRQGMSRSPAVLAGCLIALCGVTAEDAVALITWRRGIAEPNTGFVAQLRLWERFLRQCTFTSVDGSGRHYADGHPAAMIRLMEAALLVVSGSPTLVEMYARELSASCAGRGDGSADNVADDAHVEHISRTCGAILLSGHEHDGALETALAIAQRQFGEIWPGHLGTALDTHTASSSMSAVRTNVTWCCRKCGIALFRSDNVVGSLGATAANQHGGSSALLRQVGLRSGQLFVEPMPWMAPQLAAGRSSEAQPLGASWDSFRSSGAVEGCCGHLVMDPGNEDSSRSTSTCTIGTPSAMRPSPSRRGRADLSSPPNCKHVMYGALVASAASAGSGASAQGRLHCPRTHGGCGARLGTWSWTPTTGSLAAATGGRGLREQPNNRHHRGNHLGESVRYHSVPMLPAISFGVGDLDCRVIVNSGDRNV